MNPDFAVIRDSLEIAQGLNPAAIIAVIPLDVIDEAHGEGSSSYRLNESAKQSTREIACEDRKFMRSFRQNWRLMAVEPILRWDGTAQTATFLFQR